jgi:hypothetical protein
MTTELYRPFFPFKESREANEEFLLTLCGTRGKLDGAPFI